MLTRQEILESLHREHSVLSQEYGVRRVGLFGSFANGQPNEESDIDLLVEFEQPIGFRFFDLIDYLEARLGRKVDVLTPAGIQNIRVAGVAKGIIDDVIYV